MKRLLVERLEHRRLLNIDFPDFSDSTGIELVGDAKVTPDGILRLTSDSSPEIGGAWFTSEKQFVSTRFQTSFDFQLHNDADADGASGFVFLIQNNSPIPALSTGGGNMGYHGIPNSLAVEFDTRRLAFHGDTSDSHISVHSKGQEANSAHESASLGSFDTVPSGIRLDDGQVHTAQVKYEPGMLSIYLDGRQAPVLEVAVDLGELLDLDVGRAWIGFTAATPNAGWQKHDILNWRFDVAGDTSSVIGIDHVARVEGDVGTSQAVFHVRRLGDVSQEASLNWSTSVGTATSGTDFEPASGRLTFAPHEEEKTVSITVFGETAEEPREFFRVGLSNVVGATLVQSTAIGTILNDDTTLTVGDAEVTEGDSTIRYIDTFVVAESGGLYGGHNVRFGPDRNLYVASGTSNNVLRYDGMSGTFLDQFVATNAGGLNNPHDLQFGPDGDLYVGSKLSNEILRYDGRTGAFKEVFADNKSHGFGQPHGILFNDGFMYVSGGGNIVRYDSVTGKFIDEFVSAESGHLAAATDMTIGPDGNLYVGDNRTDSILRFDISTGELIDTFVTSGSGGLDAPRQIDFRGDYLYAASAKSHEILRYSAASGAYVDRFLPEGDHGLSRPIGFTFGSDDNIYVVSQDTHEVLRYGPSSQAIHEVRLSTPLDVELTIDYSTVDGTANSSVDFVPTNGQLTIASGIITRSIIVPTVDNNYGERTEYFTTLVSNPSSGIVADHDGRVDINDTDDFVVGDSNFDGIFSSSDFVTVFIAGEYEDDIPGNSAFEEGDWDGDGDFTTKDLVLAFQVGHYEKTSLAIASSSAASAIDFIFTSNQDDRFKRRTLSTQESAAS